MTCMTHPAWRLERRDPSVSPGVPRVLSVIWPGPGHIYGANRRPLRRDGWPPRRKIRLRLLDRLCRTDLVIPTAPSEGFTIDVILFFRTSLRRGSHCNSNGPIWLTSRAERESDDEPDVPPELNRLRKGIIAKRADSGLQNEPTKLVNANARCQSPGQVHRDCGSSYPLAGNGLVRNPPRP
jgi:hypothetical protein